MNRTKLDYGIDLGTTNSAISRMEAGEAKIIKSDEDQKDTTPSCVSFNKKQSMFVGQIAFNSVSQEALKVFKKFTKGDSDAASSDVFFEFKRTMGTDKRYPSTHKGAEFSSEQLSAEVLKKLKSYVRDEVVETAVITVPSMFRQNQIDATQRAAELAGFKYCELLQEPIAASIAYGIKASSMEGYWLVFDFGGGTFDAALMQVEEGVMKVIDTEGDNHLGGKNIDFAIVDQIFIPALANEYDIGKLLQNDAGKKLLQDALKRFAEEAKINLSSKNKWAVYLEDFGEDESGEELLLDLKISLADYEKVCVPIFQKAISITADLLKRNGVTGADLKTVILVGGPTFSQTLRRMLKEQLTDRIDTSVDPMTAVARGAAFFASTKDIPRDLQKRDLSKAQLTLKYPETTVEAEEHIGIRVDRDKSSASLPQKLFIEVSRADRGWSSGRLEMADDAEIVSVHLSEGKANLFRVSLFDEKGNPVPCEPSAITIIHGLKIANPTLPRSIGLEVVNVATGIQGVYSLLGLEKNQTLPGKGKGSYKTAKDIRPGNKSDKFRVVFYEFDYGTEGSRAILHQPIGEYTISGEQLPALLPANSDVDLTLSIDASRRVKLSIYMPAIDETIEIDLESNIQTEDANTLQEHLSDARSLIEQIKANTNPEEVSKNEREINNLDSKLENRRGDFDSLIEIREELRKAVINLEKLELSGQWPKVEADLDSAMENLLVTGQRYGNEKAQKLVGEYQDKVRAVKREQNIKAAKQLIEEIGALSFALVREDIGLWISYIKRFDQDFETLEWKDRREAKRLLNDAKALIASNPSKSKLEEAVKSLFDLLPRERQESVRKLSDEVLRK
ncbi:MAG: hypothetical protein A2V90_03760 [Gammaproteobacteria bacterium RBG_16_57_12]|nr:MAG: hypothetical protein A2V90_03760 [Gammaproteobacteria bacterium RBG_16_57_12]